MTLQKNFVLLRGMPPGGLAHTPLPSEAEACERAVLAIWTSLDEEGLANTEIRQELASMLEPLGALPLDGRAERLIKTLRLPDPLDASQLYWLTRRLLTLVPDLQAMAAAREEREGDSMAPSFDWTKFFKQP